MSTSNTLEPTQSPASRSNLMIAFARMVARSGRRTVTDLHVRRLLSYVRVKDRDGSGVQRSLQQLADVLVLSVPTCRRVIRRAWKHFELLVIIPQRHLPGGQTANRYAINWTNVSKATSTSTSSPGNTDVLVGIRSPKRRSLIKRTTDSPSQTPQPKHLPPTACDNIDVPVGTRAIQKRPSASQRRSRTKRTTNTPDQNLQSKRLQPTGCLTLRASSSSAVKSTSCNLNPKASNSRKSRRLTSQAPVVLPWDLLFEKLKLATSTARRLGATRIHHALILIKYKLKRMRVRSADWESAPFEWPHEIPPPRKQPQPFTWGLPPYEFKPLPPYEFKPLPPYEWTPVDFRNHDWSWNPLESITPNPGNTDVPVGTSLNSSSSPNTSEQRSDVSDHPPSTSHLHPSGSHSGFVPGNTDVPVGTSPNCECGSNPTAQTPTDYSLANGSTPDSSNHAPDNSANRPCGPIPGNTDVPVGTSPNCLCGSDICPSDSDLTASLNELLAALESMIEIADRLQAASLDSLRHSCVPLGLQVVRRVRIPFRLTHNLKSLLTDLKHLTTATNLTNSSHSASMPHSAPTSKTPLASCVIP